MQPKTNAGTVRPGIQKIVLRAPEVAQLLGTSVGSIWGWTKAGTFPKPIKLGPNTTVWRLSDIEAWIEERAQESA
jgi:predicted DNA-binding transcriptional regulator AlpA